MRSIGRYAGPQEWNHDCSTLIGRLMLEESSGIWLVWLVRKAVKIISEKLKEDGFQLLNNRIREKWGSNNEVVEHCIRFGRYVALS